MTEWCHMSAGRVPGLETAIIETASVGVCVCACMWACVHEREFNILSHIDISNAK